MKSARMLLLAPAMLVLAACGSRAPVCPPVTGTPVYLGGPPPLTEANAHLPTPAVVRIGGREVTVDQVISGPLCHGRWSGTVYVTCDVQVQAWEGQPTFFEGCDLDLAPDTVVYVADHNDTAYYNGCSCHYQDASIP